MPLSSGKVAAAAGVAPDTFVLPTLAHLILHLSPLSSLLAANQLPEGAEGRIYVKERYTDRQVASLQRQRQKWFHLDFPLERLNALEERIEQLMNSTVHA